MTVLAIVLGLAIPLGIGRGIMGWANPRCASFAERWGFSWMTGAAITATVLVLAGRIGLDMRIAVWLCGIAALAGAGFALLRRCETTASRTRAGWPEWTIIFAALIAMRVAWAGVDAAASTERMFDAYENWLLRAKVIATLGRVPLQQESPFYLGGGRTSYPLGMPMLAAWPNLIRGRWDERLANLVWPTYYAALLALLAGYLTRRCGAAFGFTAAYLLSSVPLLGIHAVRAGYADLLIAAHLLAACIASCEYVESRRRGWLAIACVNALFCVLLKREGLLFLGLLVVVTTAMIRGPGASRFGAAAAALLVGLGLAALGDVRYIASEMGALGFHPEALGVIRARLFAWDTWNLLWWVAAVALPVATWELWRRGSGVIASQAWALVLLTLCIFVFTSNYQFAVNGMTFDRNMLQIAPVVLAATGVGLARWSQGNAAHQAGAPPENPQAGE